MKKVLMALGVKGFLVLFIVFVIAVFSFQNDDPITVRFFFWKLIEIPKLYLVLASTLLGIILGILITFKFRKS
ncbi:lipopolysaccharide assembly protein LapA domain-containing protein [Bacteriovoracaceae bacterium]|nr:lipopolysaccharide assembly protein LapA domain-containing protein [Bacteriovoracaceae bacterium]